MRFTWCAIALVGCTQSSSKLCEPQAIAPSGAIRSGLVYPGSAALAATPTAVAAGACGQIDFLAANATIGGKTTVAPDERSVYTMAPDGAGGIYAEVDSASVSSELVAIAADGTLRWRVSVLGYMFAAPEGPYVWNYASTILAVRAYTPDGSIRWTIQIPRSASMAAPTVVPRKTGGFFVWDGGFEIDTYDANGTMVSTFGVWSPEFSASIQGIGSTDDGALAVFGSFLNNVVLNKTMTLTGPPDSETVFAAVVDGVTPRWAYASTSYASDSGFSTLTFDTIRSVGANLVVGGTYANDAGTALGLAPAVASASFIGVYTPTAFDHAIAIGGPATETITAVEPANDGSLWLAIDTSNPIGYNDGPSLGPAGLSIEGATYTNPNSSERTYVVNLVP